MRKQILTFLAVLLATTFSFSQESRSLPNVKVKTLAGDAFNISDLDNNNKPMVISFWATWCKPCKKELNNISEVYEDWQKETGVKLVAVSIDDTRSMSKVAPYINASDWEYEVYLDPNKDLCRLLGVSTVPHTFLLNGKKEIVWQHRGYVEGDEEALYNKILFISE
ncbi:MAG: TlpA family protein disulfide reductase [Candidatus Nitrosopelagicus sp.]|nr:TlpA family protein disulfide reductase [Candidatus Nitrosopelagicus sp.]